MNPMGEPKGGKGSPQSCLPAPPPLLLLWLRVFQRVGGVWARQGWFVCRGLWGGPGGVWRCSLAASSPPPVQKPAPSVGPLTGSKPPPGSPGCRREHVTPWWDRVMVETKKSEKEDNLCLCVCVYLQLLQQVEVLLSEALIGPLQLCSSLLLVEGWGRVQQLILQDVVLHLIGLELLGHVHLTNLMHRETVHHVQQNFKNPDIHPLWVADCNNGTLFLVKNWHLKAFFS